MGFGGISIWQLLIVLVIVLLLFGTKRLRNLGADLGNAVRGFRKAMDDKEQEAEKLEQAQKDDAIEGQATREQAPRDKEKT